MTDRKQQLIEVFEDTQKFYTKDPVLKTAVKHSRENSKLYEADEYPDYPMDNASIQVLRLSQ